MMNGAKSSEVALLRKWRRKMGALKQNENQVFNNLKKEIKQTEVFQCLKRAVGRAAAAPMVYVPTSISRLKKSALLNRGVC